MSHSCSSLSSFFGHHINSDRGFMLLSTVYIIAARPFGQKLRRKKCKKTRKFFFTISKAKTKTSCIYHRYFQLELPKNDSSPSSILVFSLYTSYCYRANTYLIVSQNMLVGYRRCRSFRLTCRSCCDRCRMVAFMMVRSCKSILSKIRGTCRNVTEVQTSWSWRKS